MNCDFSVEFALNSSIMNSSVCSYVGSSQYLRRIVPLSICNILYYRTTLSKELFEEKSIDKFNFFMFKTKQNNKIVNNIYTWMKSAMAALELNFLQELFFFMLDKNSQVLEVYKYKFTYTNEKSENMTYPSSNEVIQCTSNFFNRIRQLGKLEPLPGDISFKIELTYTNATPKEYHPKSFEHVTDIPLLKFWDDSSNYTKLGCINTGYHMAKCFGKGDMLRDLKNSAQNSAEAQKDVDKFVINVLCDSEPAATVSMSDINCGCGINYLVETIDLITCTVCKTKQHTACMKFTNVSDVPEKYICVFCGMDDTNTLHEDIATMNQEKRQIVCLYRLMLLYSHNTKNSADVILNKLGKELRENMLKKLVTTGAYFKAGDKCTINEYKKLKPILKQVFTKPKKQRNNPDSMMLDLASHDSVALPPKRMRRSTINH